MRAAAAFAGVSLLLHTGLVASSAKPARELDHDNAEHAVAGSYAAVAAAGRATAAATPLHPLLHVCAFIIGCALGWGWPWSSSYTLLHIAARAGHAPTARWLLRQRSVDVNKPDGGGRTAAVSPGHPNLALC